MIRTEEEHLAHYGILRKSGRYPWGSGASESTRNRDFLDTISMLKKDGMTDAQIAKGFHISRNELVAARSIALAQQKQEKRIKAQRLKEKGYSNPEIGRRMGGLNESSVRALLAPGATARADALHTISSMIQSHVDKKGMVDVGVGVEYQLGITRTRLDTAVAMLKEKGYVTHNIKIQQIETGKYTTMRVLAKPGTTQKEVQTNRANIKQIDEKSEDNGQTFLGFQPPISINSRRIAVRYKEDGGAEADGVIFVRRGKDDISIGSDNYAQVRIAVDGTHYLKGMAVYRDDLPPGVDLMFNTNKPRTKNKKDVMKEMNLDDPEFPFGSVVWQLHGPDGKVSSAMNKVGGKEGAGTEGAWDKWSRNLSSQMLSKQSPDLAKQQLDLTFDRRRREFDEIMSLTNPTVRKDLLLKFSDSADSAAVHLKAASLPRQATKVILPIGSIKPTEIYAPSIRDGERVALIRHPHAGRFEIPELTVNNRNREARRILGTAAKDAVGIHHTVAQHLSGADFDGDTVLVIPNKSKAIKTEPPLKGLKDFDPQIYKIPDDSPIPRLNSERKGFEMGKISNLITDMSLQGASSEELTRAVKHSMVVIDAEKHGLDYRQSEKDQGILALKERYQGGKRAGAQTLISRAKADIRVPERNPRAASRGGPIDPATGERVFEPTGRMIPKTRTVIDPATGRRKRVPTGEFVPKLIKSRRLAETPDAFTLIDKNTVMETIYAGHSNKLKALANQARKETLTIKSTPTSQSAKRVYADEVQSLNAKLNLALRNAPYERQAQLLANVKVSQRRQNNPDMEKEEVKKIKRFALNESRNATGASKTKIQITQREWDAIQAGAISKDKLEKILNNSDPETVKQLALPKQKTLMTSTAQARARSMLASGYTQQEVADALGVGLTTLKVGLSE